MLFNINLKVPAIAQVRQSFGASDTSINATISLYVFIMGLAVHACQLLLEKIILIRNLYSHYYGPHFLNVTAVVQYIFYLLYCMFYQRLGVHFLPLYHLLLFFVHSKQLVPVQHRL